MKKTLRFIIGLFLLLVAITCINTWTPWLGKILSVVGACWLCFDLWNWVQKKLS